MSENAELKKIKKVYGENFMKLCRELFPTILEKEGKLYEVLTATFANNSRTLYDDIVKNGLEADFKSYIYSRIDVEDPEMKVIGEKTPYELLEEAGYDLYECKTEEEIQKFRKYYREGEELCTFNGGRLNRCEVFWAVKKNAGKIKRSANPQREDEYGTSVMSIQFNKSGLCTVSIKNRYNHTVNNPDATYGNDLDKIVPGLAQSFSRLLEKRGLKLTNSNVEEFEIPGYVVADNGKYFKYNLEMNGVYYCPGNIVIDDYRSYKIEKPESKMLIDYFILDKEKKKISLYDTNIRDSFIDGLEDIESVDVRKDNENKGNRIITIKTAKNKDIPITIKIDENNQIIGYENPEITEIGDFFLFFNQKLKSLIAPKLKDIGGQFLACNKDMTEICLPNVETIENDFLFDNEILRKIEAPNLRKIGRSFLNNNLGITEINFPSVETIEDYFLFSNELISKLNLPNLRKVGNQFLSRNRNLTQVILQNLIKAGSGFLYRNKILTYLDAKNLKEVGDSFLGCNSEMTELNMPSIEETGNEFLYSNTCLKKFEAPNLRKVKRDFMRYNEELEELSVPNLKETGSEFLFINQKLHKFHAPNLIKTGDAFLYSNMELEELSLENLQYTRDEFLNCNKKLKKLNLPNLIEAGYYFLRYNKELTELRLPNLKEAYQTFLCGNDKLKKIVIPNWHGLDFLVREMKKRGVEVMYVDDEKTKNNSEEEK